MSSILSERTLEKPTILSVASDMLTLIKPRIATFVWFAATVGGWLGGGTWWQALEVAAYVTAIAGASCVFNMVIEKDLDRLMPRTKNRPLPAGRLSVRDALTFGITLAVLGTVGLLVKGNAIAAALGVATLIAYAFIYTPLKRITTLNTVVGAIPGAMPPLLGYCATAGEVSGWGWTLFLLLFAWQFPHFLAIAYMYRDDYAAAGMRMLSCEPNSDAMVGRQSLSYCLLLPVFACLPFLRGDSGIVFTVGAVVLGLAFCVFAARFAFQQTRSRARELMFASLVYLPILFLLVLVDPLTRRFF